MTAEGERRRFLLLYGSQTGQAEAISELIEERAVKRGLQPERHCLDKSEKKFCLEKEAVFVVVVSTTGEGDSPDNVTRFWRRLKKKTLPGDHLSSCNYALLGLGDSNYTNFCNMGKMLDKRLLQLGAKQFYPPGFADDGVGLDIVVEPWMEGLWTPLAEILQKHSSEEPDDGDAGTNAVEVKLAESAGRMKVNSGGKVVNSSVVKSAITDVPEGAESADVAETRVCSGTGPGTSAGVEGGSTERNGPEASSSSEIVDDVTTTKADGESTAAQKSSASVLPASSKQESLRTPGSKNEDHLLAECEKLESLTVCDEDRAMQDSSDISVENIHPDPISEAVKLSLAELRLSSPSSQDAPSVTSDLSGSELCSDSHSSCVIDKQRWSALRDCSADLVEVALALPSLPAAYLSVNLVQVTGSVPVFPHHEVSHGFKSPPIVMADIASSRVLTKEEAKKKTLEIELKVPPDFQYEPGDAFGFVCPNAADEIEWLLQRLCLSQEADSLMELSISLETTKRNASLPKHVPKTCTVRQFFTHCANIRSIPKKAHLRLLSQFCAEESEQRRLEELSSKQGAKDYSSLITESHTDFLDLLFTIPSCQPPLERLVEILPKLQPRYYSAASSLLSTPGCLKVVLNVEQLPSRFWKSGMQSGGRRGLASGWLEKACQVVRLGQSQEVPIFPRKLISHPFHLPRDNSNSIVLIGPGTGVSPFIGFLKHREALKGIDPSCDLGKAWLLFGCRNPALDHIFKEEVEHFQSADCLGRYDVAYSRLIPEQVVLSRLNLKTDTSPGNETPPPRDKAPPSSSPLDGESFYPKYVQDIMRRNWNELGSWLVEDKCYVYVCGDAKNMASDVHKALLDVLTLYLSSLTSDEGRTNISAERILEASRDEGRYLVDAWS